jgi:metallophosphoesterase superfamily enzyme
VVRADGVKLVAQRKELYAKYNVRLDGRTVVNLGDSRHTCGRRCSDEETVQKEMIMRPNKKSNVLLYFTFHDH